MTRAFRGVGGARVREDDEGHGRNARPQFEPVVVAKHTGRCAHTGADIRPGDKIRLTARGDKLISRGVL
ncbi:MAG: hypothetical protein AB9M53_01100 [Leptothrix sp. (in: b-proteobacteria)]